MNGNMSTEEYLAGSDTDNEIVEEHFAEDYVVEDLPDSSNAKRIAEELGSDDDMDDSEIVSLHEENMKDESEEGEIIEEIEEAVDWNGDIDVDDDGNEQDIVSIEVLDSDDPADKEGLDIDSSESIGIEEAKTELDSEEEIENLEESEQIERTQPEVELEENEQEGDQDQEVEDVEDVEDVEEAEEAEEPKPIDASDNLHVIESQDLESDSSGHGKGSLHSESSETTDSETEETVLEVTVQTETHANGTEKDQVNVDVPIFLYICGDEYLLAPFFEKSNYILEDMISLFSMDEISGKTLDQFFQLLRGNGDLIDAYNFNVEDELRIDIPELALSVTEDNVFTREMKLDDLLNCFYDLKANSEATENTDNVPDKLTIFISMQQRFVSRYQKLQRLAAERGTFAQVNVRKHDEAEPSQKKRKLST